MSLRTHVDSATSFGRRLRETRTARGLSQRALAFPGCTAVYICRIENGHRVPSLQIVRELADRLGVRMDWLATGKGEREQRRYVTAGEPEDGERFKLYRLCACEGCNGLEEVATTATPAGVGQALIELGREGEWEECAIGVLDSAGEKGKKWIVKPWLPSPRNVSDAARVLGVARKGET